MSREPSGSESTRKGGLPPNPPEIVDLRNVLREAAEYVIPGTWAQVSSPAVGHGKRNPGNERFIPETDASDAFEFLRAIRKNDSPKTLMDYGFDVIRATRKFGIIPSPRYGEYSPYLLQLLRLEYRQLDGRLQAQKMLLHLDGILNSVGDPFLDLGKIEHLPISQRYALLERILYTIYGVHPKRYRKRNSRPKTVREKTLEANLELNLVLGPDPEVMGPDYIPNLKDVNVFKVLNLEEPSSLEEVRRVNAHDAAQVRKRLGYRPKKGGYGEMTISQYRSSLYGVIKYYHAKQVVLRRVVEPLLDWRKKYFSFREPEVTGGEFGLLGPHEYYTRFCTFLERYGQLSKLFDSLVTMYHRYEHLNIVERTDKKSVRAHEELLAASDRFILDQSAFADFLQAKQWSLGFIAWVRENSYVSQFLLEYLLWGGIPPEPQDLILSSDIGDANEYCDSASQYHSYLFRRYGEDAKNFCGFVFAEIQQRCHGDRSRWLAASNEFLEQLVRSLKEQTEKTMQIFIVFAIVRSHIVSENARHNVPGEVTSAQALGLSSDKLNIFRV